MKKINIKVAQSSYEIYIGAGLLGQAGRMLKELRFSPGVVIITNPVVNRLFGGVFSDTLAGSGFKVSILEVPDGEEYKSLKVAGNLYNRLSRLHSERSTTVVALGGGVIGDLAGFVAATYMRGVPLIQVPTTLLAQVDSSLGGKVAVNHGRLKNMIGAFYQPKLVLSDTLTLKTLSLKELGNGLAEIIKYGVIRDKELFSLVEDNIDRVALLDDQLLEEIIFRSARIKAEVVEKDERDSGLRNILNFGHTVGHALETVSDFQIGHGSAVALGMVAAGRFSNRLGFFAEEEQSRLKKIIQKAGLPAGMPGMDVKKIMQAMMHDKKVSQGKIRFVLPRAIGEVFVTDEVDTALVEEVLRDFNEEA